MDTPRGSTTPLSAALTRAIAVDAALHGGVDAPPPGSGPPVTYEPGVCLNEGAIDFPPPVGIQAQVHPSAVNSTSVPSSALRFGTFDPNAPYAQAQGWPVQPQVSTLFLQVPSPSYEDAMRAQQGHTPQGQAQAQVPGAPYVLPQAPFGEVLPQVPPNSTCGSQPGAASVHGAASRVCPSLMAGWLASNRLFIQKRRRGY